MDYRSVRNIEIENMNSVFSVTKSTVHNLRIQIRRGLTVVIIIYLFRN